MKYGALIAVLALHGTALAQPGGSDLPIAPEQPSPAQPPVPQGQLPAEQPIPETQPLPPQQPQQAPTRATFVSSTEQQWDVTLDRQPVCSTPCTLGVMPLQYVALRSQERYPIRLDVGYMPAGDLMVTAKPLSNGMYATGIVFTTFSGMGLVTGITLTAVGAGVDNSSLRNAGIITAIPSAIGLAASIYLMRKALPKAEIGPARPYVAGTQVGLAGTF